MTLFSHNCSRHGHRYEGRFDKKFNDCLMGKITSVATSSGMEVLKETIYVRDICTRCGDIKERK